MLYAFFSRHETKSIVLKLAEKIKNSPLCTALDISPEKKAEGPAPVKPRDSLADDKSPVTRSLISLLTDIPHFELLRKNLFRDTTSSEHVMKNLSIAFGASLAIEKNYMEHKKSRNSKRSADEMQ